MKRRRYRYKRKNSGAKIFLIVFGAIILLLASIPIIKGLNDLKDKEGSINIRLSMSGFSPKTIQINAGEDSSIYLINMDNSMHADGGGWHQFASDDANFDFKIAPLDKKTVSIKVDNPGTYTFYCDVCCGGKENPSMQGTLIVV